jgi:hypothetical protein
MKATDRLVYQGEDGVAKVVVPSPSFIKRGGTAAELEAKTVPEDCKDSCDVVDTSTIPEDRIFRNAWQTKKGKSIDSVDISKALEIAKDKIRDVRNPKLADLDVESIRADEVGDTAQKADVVAKKKTAREATADSRLTTAKTESKLKAAMETVIAEVKAL